MHPLTKKIWETSFNYPLAANPEDKPELDKIIVSYMKERAEELKKELYPENGSILVSTKSIDHAFGLSKPTLEEKIKNINYALSYQEIDEIIELFRKHFKENPEELK